MPTIGDLIRTELDAGKSVRDLAAASGFRVKHQTFQELSKQEPKQFPKESKTVSGMAQALNCTESAVVLAYAAGLGIAVDSVSEFSLRMPAGVDDLAPEMKNALVSVVRAAVKQTGEQRAALSHDPPSKPDAQTKGDEGEEVKEAQYFSVIRYNPREPDVITYGPTIEAGDEDDARNQLRRSFDLAGVQIDSHGSQIFDVIQNNQVSALLGIVRQDRGVPHEERLIARLRERGAELVQASLDNPARVQPAPQSRVSMPPDDFDEIEFFPDDSDVNLGHHGFNKFGNYGLAARKVVGEDKPE